ncbi:SAM-dependent methyltransferase [Halomicronema hongdechloris C2206]|uniref:SAM-dependent methyltransferase n=1 Tax=Halomicronema hongdechloris C2206 TaxID=1641165 RepID=A0A1Z3HM97_9CYAN|nr:FkbM family methyltransferase [Halomicronema hongdechloris]ASC71433.1 SAM-dependent methyltransferase [Halomicronema hongdechloris C2206]
MKNSSILSRKALKYLQILTSVVHPSGYFIYPKKYYAYHKISFSQEGEDLILDRIFYSQKNGFYVDVGAHHPQRFSNTYYFYLKGWHGINIDAMPGSMELFKKIRPRDINIEIPIFSKSQVLTYYQFNEPALNGFSEEISTQRNKHEKYKIISTKKLKTERLSVVLEKNILNESQVIDFMNIDVEGLDYEVLKSNDWNRFRPKVLLVEDLSSQNIRQFENSKVYNFLFKEDYKIYANLAKTSIFLDSRT